MKLVFWIVIAVIAAFLALFAASNREAVALALWPLGAALELPLYLAILGTFLAGFVVGAAAAWIGGGRWRREARRRRRRITALEHELAVTQAQLPGTAPSRSAALAMRG
jgi:uncharacterized integral membrane protein